jgi:hypothetical protein
MSLKKHVFRKPIAPCSVVRAKDSGRHFRIGYYSKMDGLDCIWLVNEKGEYEQTIDHDFLKKYFEVESVSRERSLYGKNRPPFAAIK